MTQFPPPQRSGGFPFALYVPGALVLLFGILILVFPELLAILVAGLLLVVGAMMLGVADLARRSGRGPMRGMQIFMTRGHRDDPSEPPYGSP